MDIGPAFEDPGPNHVVHVAHHHRPPQEEQQPRARAPAQDEGERSRRPHQAAPDHRQNKEIVRLRTTRVAVPTNPNADEPSHPTTWAPRSASRGPRSTPPSFSSRRRPRSGFRITPPAISCAWPTIRPANDTPGTTMRKRASATTSVAASWGRKR